VKDVDWESAISELTEAAERMAILSRCLGVGPELARWRAGEDLGGMLAADGLDQARGDLERLVAGGATSLLDLVNRVAEALPAPME
jgi:hypothetical protein